MILLTGGAGFIGSNVLAGLNAAGTSEVVVCDRLGSEGKWRNLQKREFADFVPIAGLQNWLASAPGLEAVIHLGANSDTTAADGDQMMDRNFGASLALWRHCARTGTRFIYASSAATYGSGEHGFRDDDDPQSLEKLLPLNLYAWSKHVFDRRIAREVALGMPAPPRWYGLKFFNVYGPNEYHKGHMRSMVFKITTSLVEGAATARLFSSLRPDVPDGGQSRDFVYVDDVCEMIMWLLRSDAPPGIYNIGSGQVRSFAELARAVFAALDREAAIEFFPMPDALRGRYQYWTEADISKLRRAGYGAPTVSLEEGVRRYVTEYLVNEDRYR